MKKNKVSFFPFDTEEEAIQYKKKNRWRKGTISYSNYWKCWILVRS